ncbi:PREDICTED: gamma-butyrobetaine dioxygenase-like [Priapulus caudatus]|uniref:Gamma-butyrobetaine dioxygenase-like n=1 Tax=Priapulus caudatus TaxID=37621 RepID=A0ABM1E165_PRICU|nr:PREDICTED: gamma-butyrobetaine dioxygenase-like [Priapulus caudatus]
MLRSCGFVAASAARAFSRHVNAASSVPQRVSLAESDHLLSVDWKDGHSSAYPLVWLLDNCPSRINSGNGQRVGRLTRRELRLRAASVSLEKGRLVVRWENGELSVFPVDWLRRHCFSPTSRHAFVSDHADDAKLWDADRIRRELFTCAFADVIADDAVLFRLLFNLDNVGICLIKEAPKTEGQLARLCARVGFVRETHYGTYFTVKSKENPNNNAYTSSALDLHVDLPQITRTPDFQFLHCITQAGEGGENCFVDGFRVAQVLRDKYPDDYYLLTTTKLQYTDRGCEPDTGLLFHNTTMRCPIELASNGDVKRVYINNHTRSSFIDADPKKILRVYEAWTRFYDLSYEARHLFRIKLTSGDVICFKNSRVLHGREAFTGRSAIERHLQGCYMDEDVVRSKLLSIRDAVSNKQQVDNQAAA